LEERSMTNGTRLVRGLDPANEHDRGLPCVVRHPDACGPCGRTATMKLYGLLNFCPEHGEEARIGADMERHYDAGYFFDRFRNPHVPDLNSLVERELEDAVGRMNEGGPSDNDYYRTLARAYPEPPEYVREQLLRWERDERNGGDPPVDLLLDSLMTVRKLMRFAHEDGEDWLVEILEHERQELAARAAFACEIAGLQPA
jgi:hypothetical protein